MVPLMAGVPPSRAHDAGVTAVPPGRTDVRLVIAAVVAPAVVAAVAVLLFWLLREPPPGWDCGERPAGQPERLDRYRTGLVTLHVAAAAAAIAGLLVLSRLRALRAGRRGIGRATAIGIVAALLAAVPVGLVGGVALGAVSELLGGPQVLAVVAVTALSAAASGLAARTAAAPDEPPFDGVALFLWALLALLPGHALAVGLQGSGPWFCF
jgi:hypothetical protein